MFGRGECTQLRQHFFQVMDHQMQEKKISLNTPLPEDAPESPHSASGSRAATMSTPLAPDGKCRRGSALSCAEKRCRQAIRHFCLECQGRLPKAVEYCRDLLCPLFSYRLHGSEEAKAQTAAPPRPLRAVRRQCLACCGGERAEVRHCSAGRACSLWEFRFGVSPATYKQVKARFLGPKHFTLPGLDL